MKIKGMKMTLAVQTPSGKPRKLTMGWPWPKAKLFRWQEACLRDACYHGGLITILGSW